YDYNGADAGFDNAVVLYTFEGDVAEVILDTDMPEAGELSFTVEPGNTLFIGIVDDGFTPLASNTPSELTITNFVFTPPSLRVLDFETCWGIVNAEDKTPPAVVTEVEDVNLLCVDLDANTLTTLPANISKCYEVFSNNRSATASGQVGAVAGTTVAGTMAPQLRARLLAGG
ncbi:hypothetical protein QWY85_12665, partial [Neolewinella lacunae]|uniref:hypothetical protein n=1 Tax=Neolewinella lacunae TaxID=1517758 RepID=UPI0025B35C68